tara:strand:+ start:684 stop:1970 length:1287 start_codon:yes stop_codon:yes gene_type:complete
MANTKISLFPQVLNGDIRQMTSIAGAGNSASATNVNVRISGSSLLNSLEAFLDLNSFSTGTLQVLRGGTGANTFTDHGILIGNATNAVSATAELANGQLLIGSTGNAPVPATLTQGTDISITNASGGITIDHGSVSNVPGTGSTSLNFGDTFTSINSVTVSSQGHLTAQTTQTYTLPSAPTGATGAPPTTAITGTVANGTASTFMRSDAVPALSNEITIGDSNNRGLVDIEGGNSLDAQLRLNCSNGTHAVTIEGPAHLNGNNYIVKLPTGLPAAGNVLEVDTYAANGGGSDYNNPPLATMKWSNPSQLVTQSLIVAASDETTDLTTGTAKSTFRMPYAFTLSAVRASVTTAPTGSTIIVNIKESGTTILSSRITIDATEKTSVTAAAQPVISDTALADDSEITVDIDQVGSTVAGTGLKITLIGTKA